MLLILLCLSRVALHQAHQPCPTLTLNSGLPAVYPRPLHVPLTPLSLYTCSSLKWDPTPSSPSQAHLLLQHQSIHLTPSLSGWVLFLCFHAILCSVRIVLGWSKSSFRFFHKVVWTNPNKLLGQPNTTCRVFVWEQRIISKGYENIPPFPATNLRNTDLLHISFN